MSASDSTVAAAGSTPVYDSSSLRRLSKLLRCSCARRPDVTSSGTSTSQRRPDGGMTSHRIAAACTPSNVGARWPASPVSPDRLRAATLAHWRTDAFSLPIALPDEPAPASSTHARHTRDQAQTGSRQTACTGALTSFSSRSIIWTVVRFAPVGGFLTGRISNSGGCLRACRGLQTIKQLGRPPHTRHLGSGRCALERTSWRAAQWSKWCRRSCVDNSRTQCCSAAANAMLRRVAMRGWRVD
jgi:hypothetical protein